MHWEKRTLQLIAIAGLIVIVLFVGFWYSTSKADEPQDRKKIYFPTEHDSIPGDYTMEIRPWDSPNPEWRLIENIECHATIDSLKREIGYLQDSLDLAEMKYLALKKHSKMMLENMATIIAKSGGRK